MTPRTLRSSPCTPPSGRRHAHATPSHGGLHTAPLAGTGAQPRPTPRTPTYSGPDSFTFKANDGSLDSTAATVTITVTAVNDARSPTTAVGHHQRGHSSRRHRCTRLDADGDTLHLRHRQRRPATAPLTGGRDVRAAHLHARPPTTTGLTRSPSRPTTAPSTATRSRRQHDHDHRHLGQRRAGRHRQHGHHQRGQRLHLRRGRLRLQRSRRLARPTPAGGQDHHAAGGRHADQQRRRGHGRRRSVTVADITAGKLVFTPAANANGAGYASFTFQVQDDGGTANGGVDLDQSANTITVNVTLGQRRAGRHRQDGHHQRGHRLHLRRGRLRLHRPERHARPTRCRRSRSPRCPGAGTLTNNGVAVAAGDVRLRRRHHRRPARLHAGRQRQRRAPTPASPSRCRTTAAPPTAASTSTRAPTRSPSTSRSVNDAPAGTDKTVTHQRGQRLHLRRGRLRLHRSERHARPTRCRRSRSPRCRRPARSTLNGVAVAAGQLRHRSPTSPPAMLVFTPAANANGAAYASFTFQVQDDGGTANGGVDLDQSANTITVNVTLGQRCARPAPTRRSRRSEDTAYTFAAADFGFTDPSDSPANALPAVKITTLPARRARSNNGVAVTAGDIRQRWPTSTAGKLVFTPAANANGAAYASFTFQVQDDGGTANGGVDLDQSANTITVNVTSVNDAPAGTDKTITTIEDTAYVFGAADFGFTDPPTRRPIVLRRSRSPPSPGAGTLTAQRRRGDARRHRERSRTSPAATPCSRRRPMRRRTANYDELRASQPFQDDGGTANGGANLDAIANTHHDQRHRGQRRAGRRRPVPSPRWRTRRTPSRPATSASAIQRHARQRLERRCRSPRCRAPAALTLTRRRGHRRADDLGRRHRCGHAQVASAPAAQRHRATRASPSRCRTTAAPPTAASISTSAPTR